MTGATFIAFTLGLATGVRYNLFVPLVLFVPASVAAVAHFALHPGWASVLSSGRLLLAYEAGYILAMLASSLAFYWRERREAGSDPCVAVPPGL